MTLSKNRILGSPEFQISNFSLLGFSSQISPILLKNLWREMTPSQNWILGTEHERASTAWPTFRPDSDFLPSVYTTHQPRVVGKTIKIPNVSIWAVASHISLILKNYKGKWYLPKTGFRACPGIKKFKISRLCDFFSVMRQISPILWRIHQGK